MNICILLKNIYVLEKLDNEFTIGDNKVTIVKNDSFFFRKLSKVYKLFWIVGIFKISILRNIFNRLVFLFNKKLCENYDVYICFDNYYYLSIFDYIGNSNCKKVVWMWNSVKSKQNIFNYIQTKYDNIWTFDVHDSLQYNIMYHPQFYYVNSDFESIEIEEYDFLFIGYDKGRLSKLLDLYQLTIENGLKFYMYVLPSPLKKYSSSEKEWLSDKEVKYDTVINYVKKSRAIIDLITVGQVGFTLRIMEGMFYNKKVITNNVNIKEQDFYDSSRFYILGIDTNITDFLNTPIKKYTKRELQPYLFQTWLENIISS